MHKHLSQVERGGLLNDGRLVRGHEAGHAPAHGLRHLSVVAEQVLEDVAVAGEDEPRDEGDGAGAEVGRGALEVGEGARDEGREHVPQGPLLRVRSLAEVPENR